jgi:hypothetical protein
MNTPKYRLDKVTGMIYYKLGHAEECIMTVHCPKRAKEVLKWLKNGARIIDCSSNLTNLDLLINLHCN